MGNSYSDKFFEELSKYLENVQEIKKVILNDIFTSRKEDLLISLDHLNKALQNKNIVLFDLSNNAICPNGCLRIKDIFMTNKTIKYLFLNHSALSQDGTVTISQFLKESELDLVQFEATKNRIEIQIDKLSPVLANMKSLQTVVLFQNNIKDEQMTNLIKNLSQCQNLKHVDLSDNYLPSESIEELKNLIKNNKNLKILKISDCNISEENSENFLDFVSNQEQIQLEFLGYNYNEIESLENCLNCLQKLTKLQKLEIKGIFEDEEQWDEIKEKLNDVEILFESDYEDEEEDLQVQEQSKMNSLIKEFQDMQFQLIITLYKPQMNTDQERQHYIQKYNQQRASYKTPFSEQEKKASKKLNQLLQNLLENYNIYKSLFENLKILKNSELFKELRKMPKGVIHHLHNPACADMTVIEHILKDKRAFMNPQTNVIKLINTENDQTEDNFVRISKLNQNLSWEKIIEKMRKKIIFDEEKFYGQTNHQVFDSFITAFESLDIVFNEKYYELQVQKTFEILHEDNIQAVELRNIFGSMKQDEDLEIMPLEKELDLQQKIFDQVSQKFDINYALYQTGLKNIGKEHIEKSLNQYISSMKTHPGLIRGYDMCHWEDYLYIADVYEQLKQAKEKHKVHYCFHAGESLKPHNTNVIDALTLGSQRLGHGVQVVNSSYLIDLVREKNVSVELNPYSNYMLGYVRDLNQHPGKTLMQSGVKVTINPDDYAIFDERGVTLDYVLTMVYLKFDLKDIKCCLQNSIDFSVFSNEEKSKIQKKFDQAWKIFIDNLAN